MPDIPAGREAASIHGKKYRHAMDVYIRCQRGALWNPEKPPLRVER